MQPHPATSQPPATPPLPDNATARDANYAELAALVDMWMRDEHAGEPEWDLDDRPPIRLRMP